MSLQLNMALGRVIKGLQSPNVFKIIVVACQYFRGILNFNNRKLRTIVSEVNDCEPSIIVKSMMCIQRSVRYPARTWNKFPSNKEPLCSVPKDSNLIHGDPIKMFPLVFHFIPCPDSAILPGLPGG